MRARSLSLTTGERFATGCCATLSNGTSHHFAGAGTDAVRAAAAYCDTHAVKIVSLSTPATIYRDLQGSRLARSGRHLAETKMLAAIGRLDLIA